MGSQQYRSELERKQKQILDAEKKAGEFRIKESKKRSEADKAALPVLECVDPVR